MICLHRAMLTDTFGCSGEFSIERFKRFPLQIERFSPFRYPTINPRSEYNEVKTYSGPIGSVRFMYGDRTLITVGGTDASLMIWDLIEE